MGLGGYDTWVEMECIWGSMCNSCSKWTSETEIYKKTSKTSHRASQNRDLEDVGRWFSLRKICNYRVWCWVCSRESIGQTLPVHRFKFWKLCWSLLWDRLYFFPFVSGPKTESNTFKQGCGAGVQHQVAREDCFEGSGLSSDLVKSESLMVASHDMIHIYIHIHILLGISKPR